MSHLLNLHSPKDIKSLSVKDLSSLAEEIRSFIIKTVSATGGHLASNLGTVEMTLALHRVYDFSQDRLLFDVGHQCYTHKILTGRKDRFPTLRQSGGISGFPNPQESEYDPLLVGHASTSISSALGFAIASRLQGDQRKAVAIVGDGAIGGGLCFEAINHAGHSKEDLLVILNDNEMSIAKTVGSFARYLTEIRTRPATHAFREELHRLFQSIPWIGQSLDWAQEKALDAVKNLVDAGHLFYSMGFKYYGPLDGHDLGALLPALEHLKEIPGPKLLHLATKKGIGLSAAAEDPETYHAAVPFEIRGSGEVISKKAEERSWTTLFAETLIDCAARDPRLVAITAAMPAGTGIKAFADRYPSRFFDVGICEAHSVSLAAALAKGGLRPVVAIYSTFLQRAYDQLVHDLAAQGPLPVVFAIDRAGLVGADGPTHHGVFDISFLRHIPGLTLLAPRDGEELTAMLEHALTLPGPSAIRYPRGIPLSLPPEISSRSTIQTGKAELLLSGSCGTLLAYGRPVSVACQAALALRSSGLALQVFNARFAKPLDPEMLLSALRSQFVFTLEENVISGGFGSAVLEAMAQLAREHSLPLPPFLPLGVPDRFISHGANRDLEAQLHLDAAGVEKTIREVLRG